MSPPPQRFFLPISNNLWVPVWFPYLTCLLGQLGNFHTIFHKLGHTHHVLEPIRPETRHLCPYNQVKPIRDAASKTSSNKWGNDVGNSSNFRRYSTTVPCCLIFRNLAHKVPSFTSLNLKNIVFFKSPQALNFCLFSTQRYRCRAYPLKLTAETVNFSISDNRCN